MKISYSEFKLYLEGERVEFNSIQLQETASSPSSCQISLPANHHTINLLPGTLAHLFVTYNNETYLAFEGELIQKSFSKTGVARSASLLFTSITGVFNRVFATPVELLSMRAKHNDEFYLIDSTNEDKTAFNFKGEELLAIGEGFLSITQDINEFIDTIRKSSTDGELLDKAIRKLIIDFKKKNKWFEYFYESMKFDDRVTVFQNIRSLFTLLKNTENILMSREIAPLGNLATMTQVLYRVIGHFGHLMVHLPKPCAGKSLTSSLVFLANNSYMCPIRTNVFFGDVVQSANFVRNDVSEHTRMSLDTSPMQFILDTADINVKPTYFAPRIEKINQKKGQIDYTIDEQYFGIIGSHERLTGMAQAWANIPEKIKRDGGEVLTQREIEEYRNTGITGSDTIEGEFIANTYIKRLAMKRFWDNKYRTRQFSITAPYNPCRIAGFRGLFVDEVLPAVAGLVTSINTTISSDGAAVSAVLFSNPTVVWDWNENEEGLKEADYIPSLDVWFDSNTYGFSKVGPKVYNEVLGEGERTKDLSSINKWESLPTYKELIDSLPTPTNLYKIINDETNQDHCTVKMAILVKAVKNHYYSLTEEQKINFSTWTTDRKLLTENEYWKWFLSNFEKTTDDEIFLPQFYKKDDLYRDVENEEDYISIDKETHETYKPFIKQRLEAVRRMK